MPRGKRSDWIFINVFFLLIYRKRMFCAEAMRERLTFHFELRTRSGNFHFFFFSSFLLSFFFFFFFFFFQIKARSRLVTVVKKAEYCKGCIVVSEACCSFHFYVDFCVNIFFCTTWKVVCVQFSKFVLVFFFFFLIFVAMSSLSWVFIIHVFGVHQCGI